MRDCRICEQSSNIPLGQRHQIPEKNRQCRQGGENRCPTGNHCMPGGAPGEGPESNKDNFPEHEKRGHLRTGRDESSGRYWRSLIGVGRPEMKWGGRDFESEANERHDDSSSEKWRRWSSTDFLSDRAQTGRSGHPVNEAEPEKSKCARGAAEKEVLQARFSRADIGFVEASHDIKRQTG